MNKLALIQQYIDGWKENDVKKITSCLIENCVVTESHGPVYHGIASIKRWFDLWLAAQSHVIRWDIISYHYLEKENVAFIEWDFANVSNGREYTLLGISVVKYTDDKIASIHEYRMTQVPYVWQQDKLQSE